MRSKRCSVRSCSRMCIMVAIMSVSLSCEYNRDISEEDHMTGLSEIAWVAQDLRSANDDSSSCPDMSDIANDGRVDVSGLGTLSVRIFCTGDCVTVSTGRQEHRYCRIEVRERENP